MKQNIAKVFTFSLLASSISFISCVDNEKNLLLEPCYLQFH